MMNSTIRIVVVEDDSILASSILEGLHREGYEIACCVSTREEALEVVKQELPDLVLMDIELTGAMDGITAADQIWTMYHVPVIYLTSHTTPAVVERAKRTEPFDFLVKPFHIKELHATIETVLYKYRMERALQDANQHLEREVRERKQAENALRESTNLFRTLIENQGEGIVFIDRGEHFVFANPAAEHILGVVSGELIGRSAHEFLADVDFLQPPQEIGPHHSGETNTYEVQLTRADGEVRDLLFTATSRFDQGHQFIGIFGIFRDITERKIVERALQASEDRFRKISELISDYAYVFNIDEEGTWKQEWVTDAFIRITGYTPEEVDAHGGWGWLIHPEDQAIFEQHQQLLLAGTKAINEYRIVTRHQDIFWLRDYGNPVWSEPLGRVVQVFGAAQDISERKQAELQMQQLWQRLKFLLTVSPTVIYTASPGQELHLSFVSENVQKLLGYTPYDVLDDVSFWKTHIHADDVQRVLEEIARVGETGHCTHEYRIRHKDGTYLWLRDEMIVARDAEPVEIIGSWSNITERKQAAEERHQLEVQLRQTQRLEALGTLAGGIAHDFNNILGTMLGYTDLLLDTIPESTQEHTFLERVSKAGGRAKELVQQILAFSRSHEFQPLEPIHVGPIVEEVLRFIRATIPMNVTVQHHLQPECPQILANATQIHRVLVNLCVNAAHAMKSPGGLLEVTLEKAQYSVDQRQILGLTKGDYVKLTVKDTGCGMPPEVKERIFEPFFTTKGIGEGSGLGLSVVHGIVKSHHGVIAVDSEPGQGTQVRVFFPATTSFVGVGKSVEEKSTWQGRGSIMVVDDEPALVKLYEIALTKRGYHVSAFRNSVQALELFRRDPTAFDLLIVDQDMPDVTGIQLSSEVLRIRPDMPVILVTGYSADISEEKLKEIGIRQWFMKPLNAGDLIQAIRTILHELQ